MSSELPRRLRTAAVRVLPFPVEMGALFDPRQLRFPPRLYNGCCTRRSPWSTLVIHVEPVPLR